MKQSSRHILCAANLKKRSFLNIGGRHTECACYFLNGIAVKPNCPIHYSINSLVQPKAAELRVAFAGSCQTGAPATQGRAGAKSHRFPQCRKATYSCRISGCIALTRTQKKSRLAAKSCPAGGPTQIRDDIVCNRAFRQKVVT